MIPALRAWMTSPVDGLEDEDDEVGAVEDVELGLADADGLDEDAVHAEGVQDVGRVGRRRRQPAVARRARPSSG